MDNIRITPISPYSWPQDRLQVPSGQGTMTKIDPLNQNVAKREAFSYGTYVTEVQNTPTTVIIPTTADADFWCDSIAMYLSSNSYSPKLFISDLRTGENLGFPYVRLQSFVPGFNAAVVPTGGSGVIGTLIQPFCFTRNGGIQITIQLDAVVPGVDITQTYHFAFHGWKEYQYASR